MQTLPNLRKVRAFSPENAYPESGERLWQLSEQAWSENRFAQAAELSRLAEIHEREYRASQRRAA
ncbi:MAG: hypothetical protein ACREN8_08965 [Candidatus Dormibacteraceae bacterium]